MKKSFFLFAFTAVSLTFNCAFSQSNDILTAPVGIGTSSPNSDLHIHSSVLHEYIVGPQFGNRDGFYDGYFLTTLRMTNTQTGSGNNDGFLIRQFDKEVDLQQNESAYFKILSKSGKGLTIDSAGRIGIGTDPVNNRRLVASGLVGFTGDVYCSGNINADNNVYSANLSATSNLTVGGNSTLGNGFYCSQAGQVRTKEIVVTLTGWSDYVFDSDYKLMPLGELERYVKANKHLPNIPTAGEVESDGVNVGEMNALLLEKIEELTLYIIDLQKQIDELKK